MSIVSNIVKPIVSSIVKPISRGDILRNIISFDGANQYGTLATPWAPGGQGRITLHTKAVVDGSRHFFFDNQDDVNRLYMYIETTNLVLASAGLTVSVDGGGNSITNDGLVHEIVLTGDMSGLLIRNIGTDRFESLFLNGNILYAKFEDLSTTVAGTNDLEFDFSSGTSTEAPINEGASNLITYQNYSADQWGRYRQLLNGNWERIVSPFDIIVLSDYLKGL